MIRKAASIIVAALVLFFTVISILAIWDIINIEKVFQKSIMTLLVLFICAAIMLFIFSVLFKSGDDNSPNQPPKPPPINPGR